jgi:hypothetical protein
MERTLLLRRKRKVSNRHNHGVTRRFHMVGRAEAVVTRQHNGNSIAEPSRPWTDVDQSPFNILDPTFEADPPNHKWLADFTCIWTAEA